MLSSHKQATPDRVTCILQHHHHYQALLESVAFSTDCFQCSLFCANLRAAFSPKFLWHEVCFDFSRPGGFRSPDWSFPCFLAGCLWLLIVLSCGPQWAENVPQRAGDVSFWSSLRYSLLFATSSVCFFVCRVCGVWYSENFPQIPHVECIQLPFQGCWECPCFSTIEQNRYDVNFSF